MSRPPLSLLLYDDRHPVSSRVVELLADWSASGWAQEHAALSVADVNARHGDAAGLRVVVPSNGSGPAKTVRLADLLDHRDIRLVAVDPLGVDAEWVTSRQALHDAASGLYHSLAGRRSGALDIMIPWHGALWAPDVLKWSGWDTLIVAPESATSVAEPGLALHVDTTNDRETSRLASHAAAFLATVSGLWTGLPSSAFDNTGHSDDLRLGRSFYRRMDATEIADRLRSHVFTMESARSPDARGSEAVGPLNNRVQQLRQTLVLLPMPPVPPAPPVTAITPWAAIKQFLSFMFGSLIRSPKDIAGGQIYRMKQNAAERLQRAIYGSDSALVITVGGVTADGSLVTTTERDAQLDELRTKVPVGEGAAAARQSRFWGLTFDTAWTLASGVHHGPVEPTVDGGFPQYYAAESIAPPLSRPWSADGGLAIDGLPAEVALHDVRAVRQASGHLQRAIADPSYRARPAAERNRQALEARAASWHSSFFGRLGTMIADGIDYYDAAIDRCITALGELSRTDSAEAEEIARKLGRFARIFTAIVILVAVASVALTVLGLLGLPLAVVLPVLGIIYLATMFAKFWSKQRQIYQLMHRAKVADNETERIERELPVLIENAHRMRQVYGQYLQWAQVSSAFMREPFGANDSAHDEQRGMTGYLPKSVACGVYRVADEQDAQRISAHVALDLRCSLGSLWESFVGEGLRQLVIAKPQFERVKAESIFDEFETTKDGALASWIRTAVTLDESGVRISPTVASAMDVQQMERLVTNLGAQQLTQLLRAHRVEGIGAGGMAVSDRLSIEGDLAPFQRDVFSATGMRMRDVDRSASVHPRSTVVRTINTRHWLDEIDAVLAVTEQLTFDDLDLPGRASSVTGVAPVRRDDVSGEEAM